MKNNSLSPARDIIMTLLMDIFWILKRQAKNKEGLRYVKYYSILVLYKPYCSVTLINEGM